MPGGINDLAKYPSGNNGVLSSIAPAAAGLNALDWFKAASPLISGVLGGDAPPSSSSSSSAYQNNSNDFGGFQVTTGSGSNSNTPKNGYLTYAIVAGAFIIAYKYFKKK
jgi:hypothetical protein